MSQGRNFPEDFFGDTEEDPIKENDLFGADDAADASTATSPEPSGQSGSDALADSVFATSPSPSETGGAASSQKERAIMVTRHPDPDQTSGLDDLNEALDAGWSIAHVALMSGSQESTSSMHFSALVLLREEE
jgi:hypothetical protein